MLMQSYLVFHANVFIPSVSCCYITNCITDIDNVMVVHGVQIFAIIPCAANLDLGNATDCRYVIPSVSC